MLGEAGNYIWPPHGTTHRGPDLKEEEDQTNCLKRVVSRSWLGVGARQPVFFSRGWLPESGGVFSILD